MRATYPAYLGRPAEAIAVGEPARVPQGTVIDISGRASTSLRDVRLGTLGDTIRVSGERPHVRRDVSRRARAADYAWIANGANGPIADVPPPLELEVVPDSAPHVELVSPATDTIVAGDDKIALHATASDDHGIAHVEIVTWRQGSTESRNRRSRSVWPTCPRRVGWQYGARPRGRALKPGDALHVKIVAQDNSPWGQRGESRELLLKIPTMEERRAIARESMDSAVSQVNSAAQEEKSIQQRTSDAARDRTQRATQDAPANAAPAA